MPYIMFPNNGGVQLFRVHLISSALRENTVVYKKQTAFHCRELLFYCEEVYILKCYGRYSCKSYIHLSALACAFNPPPPPRTGFNRRKSRYIQLVEVYTKSGRSEKHHNAVHCVYFNTHCTGDTVNRNLLI